MAETSAIKTFRSQMFTSPPVRAVFPDLNKPDKFGAYKIAVDVLNNPEFKGVLEKQAAETVLAGQIKLETKKKPTNAIFKQGEYTPKGSEVGEPFERISFKMKAETKRKGQTVTQRPRLVDAHRNQMNEVVFGGSLVKIAYFFQYAVTPTGTFITPKLNAVQVLEHVGPGGEASIDSMFDEEEGYVSQGTPPEADEGGASNNDGTTDGPKSAREF